MIVTKTVFFECLERMKSHIPFEQSNGWNEFKIVNGVEFAYFVDDTSSPTQACFGRIYYRKIIGRIVDICGEVKKEEVSKRLIIKFFRSIIKDAHASMITYNSISTYRAEDEIGIRCAGFVRPWGNRTCPLTQIINIQRERNCDRGWRRNLRKAKDAGLTFEVIDTPTNNDAVLFTQLFDELKQRKHLGFSIEKNKIASLLKHPEFKLCYVKHEGKVLCSRIIYLYHEQAADVFAANSFEAMKYSATHFIMENIFEWLKMQGIQVFDFSRISPSAHEANSIYQFKDAAGGYPIQYLGEWIWTKKDYIQLLFGLYNFFTHKHSY